MGVGGGGPVPGPTMPSAGSRGSSRDEDGRGEKEEKGNTPNEKKSSIRFVKGTIYKSVTYFTRLGFTD